MKLKEKIVYNNGRRK